MAVTALEIRSHASFAEGASFGATGPYERLDGTLRFAVDPALAANKVIADIDRAPSNERGLVEFWADFCLVQPLDPARGNRTLLMEVVNRGRQGLGTRFNRAPEVAPGTIHPGDGFLLRHGWTLGSVGWQWDVVPSSGLMGLHAPMAVDERGQPLGVLVSCEFQPNARQADQLLANRIHHPYLAADIEDREASLTVRDWADGPRTTIGRGHWCFGRDEQGRPSPANTHVWLEGGFQPGKIYEVIYRSGISPLVGCGLLAYRDAATFLRYASQTEGNPAAGALDRAIGYGASQSGRFLRHFLYLGLNVDEAGRIVYDGLLPHIAGARRGEFNHRGGQPSVQSMNSPSVLMPFSYEEQTDPVTGQTDGLLRRQRAAGGELKIVATNTAAEYWRGDAALTHVSIDGKEDIQPPSNVRTYLFAGTQHGSGAVPLSSVSPIDGAHGANAFNAVDYGPLLRAALMNLLAWVRDGVEPPANAVPRLSDGSGAPREGVLSALAKIPGTALPDAGKLPRIRRLDYGPQVASGILALPPKTGEPYPSFVSAVDADGNEIAGIRLPDISVPLATYTGWNPRHPQTGGEGQILAMMGSTLPFAPTADARRASDDPRPSIAERYGSRETFLSRVREAAQSLARERFVLEEDIELLIDLASARYDCFTGQAAQAG